MLVSRVFSRNVVAGSSWTLTDVKSAVPEKIGFVILLIKFLSLIWVSASTKTRASEWERFIIWFCLYARPVLFLLSRIIIFLLLIFLTSETVASSLPSEFIIIFSSLMPLKFWDNKSWIINLILASSLYAGIPIVNVGILFFI